MQSDRRYARGFTLIELLIGVAVIAVILVLAAPSFREYIVLQRLKSVNAQVVSDLQWARSEAVSRGQPVRARFQPAASGTRTDLSCYIIYIDTVLNASETALFSSPTCDCKAAEGQRCTQATTQELKTVQLDTSRSVLVDIAPYSFTYNGVVLSQDHQAFDPRTGGVSLPPVDESTPSPGDFLAYVLVNDSLKYGIQMGRTGRVRSCIPSGSTLQGDAC